MEVADERVKSLGWKLGEWGPRAQGVLAASEGCAEP